MEFKEVKIENSNQEKIIKDKKSILDCMNFLFFSNIKIFIDKEKIRKYGPLLFYYLQLFYIY